MTMLAIATLAVSNVVTAKYDVAAYVWPAYQPEPRWAELGIFKAGKGEWQSVWEAVPKWEGHRQPLKPLWGYENEADPSVVEKKIDAAVSHGVNVFIYDWYWFGGRPFLEDALNKGFLGAKNNDKMKFFIMWANHNVNWLWDNTVADKRWGTLREGWVGAVTDEEFRTKLVPRWITQYFGKSNYYRIDGKPVLMIYEVGTFVQGIGGVEKAAAAIAYLRAEAVKAGLGGVHLMVGDAGIQSGWIKALGIDSASMYNFVHWSSPAGNPDYAEWAKRGAQRFDAAKRELGIAAYFPHASVGWDTNPRYPKDSVEATAVDSTPEKFEVVLRRAKDWSDRNTPAGAPHLITVNSWNEWTEGSYLEPDTINGFGYLEAVRRVFGADRCVCCSQKGESLLGEKLEKAEYDPSVWHFDAEGNLTAKSDKAIWTKCGEWGDFELDLEYNLDPAANSGILIYCQDKENWIPNAVEVQLVDDAAEKWAKDPAYMKTGSLYGHLAPLATPQKPAGQWNRAVLTAKGSLLTLVINGVVVQDKADLSKMTSAKTNPDGTAVPPWLSRPWSDLPTKGFIGLQGKHADATVRFRNIKVRKL